MVNVRSAASYAHKIASAIKEGLWKRPTEKGKADLRVNGPLKRTSVECVKCWIRSFNDTIV